MFYRLILIVFILFTSCSNDDDSNICFELSDEIDDSFFLKQTQRTSIKRLRFADSTEVQLPNQEKYNYFLHKNLVEQNSILINRVDKDKLYKEYDYCILKIEKSTKYNVLDSICFKASLNENSYIASISLSNDRTKIAIVYSDETLSDNDKCLLKIIDLNNDEIIFKYDHKERLFLGETPWNLNDSKIIFYSSSKDIFVYDIEAEKISRISINGSNAMWLQSLDKISYLKKRNILTVYDLKTSTEEGSYKISDKLCYRSNIVDYYWFMTQKKFYIKTRFSNLFSDKLIPWKNENFIFKYKCLD